MSNKRPKILITGATGQAGCRTIEYLLSNPEIEIVAAVRSPEKAAFRRVKGIGTGILDFDLEKTHLPALKEVIRL